MVMNKTYQYTEGSVLFSPPTGASRLLSTQASRLMQLGRFAVGGSKVITMNNAGSLDGDHDGGRLYLRAVYSLHRTLTS